MGLNFKQEATEADLRYGLVRVRENAESIAFYSGSSSEVGLLLGRLGKVVGNYRSLLTASRNLDFFQSAYRYIIILLPAAVVAPLFFQVRAAFHTCDECWKVCPAVNVFECDQAPGCIRGSCNSHDTVAVSGVFMQGKIEFGVVSQSQSAFSHVLSDVSLVVYQFESLAGFSAVVDRLGQFQEGIEAKGKLRLSEDAEYALDPESRIEFVDGDSASVLLPLAPRRLQLIALSH